VDLRGERERGTERGRGREVTTSARAVPYGVALGAQWTYSLLMARDRARAWHSASRPALSVLFLAHVCFGLLASEAVAAAPPNDDFGHATRIRAGSSVKGTITRATRQHGEPRHHRSSPANSVWYRFRSGRRLALRLGTCAANFDSVIAVYSGRSLPSLRPVDYNEDAGCGPSGKGSVVTFTARTGRTYWIAVAGSPARGHFRLETSRVAVPPNDDFAGARPIALGSSIAGTTHNATRELGEPSHDFLGVRTVWFRFQVAEAGMVRLDACTGRAPHMAVYTGRRVSALSPVAANKNIACASVFQARPGVIYRVALADFGVGGRFQLIARAFTPPPNDNFSDATPITLGSTTSSTTRDASTEPGEPTVLTKPLTVWFRLTIAAPTTVAFNTCAGTTPIRPRVFQGDRVDQLTIIGPDEVICNPQLALQPGVYSIQVVGVETDFTLSTEAVPPTP